MTEITREQLISYLESLPREKLDEFAGLMKMTAGEAVGGLKGSCPGCPFNDGATKSATEASNYGCLPSPYDIYQMKKETGHNWACHEDESKVCAGLCHRAKPEGLDLTQGGLIRYSIWEQEGQAAALEQAK